MHNVITDVLLRICNILDCDIKEIVEYINIENRANLSD